MKFCRCSGSGMGSDRRNKCRRDICGGSRPAILLFSHLGGLSLSVAREISAPHRRAPVQHAG